VRVFVTHNPEDFDAYYARSIAELSVLTDVIRNPFDRDLTTTELIDAAAGCEIIIAHRATPGDRELFERSPELLAFLRCAVDVSTVDIDAADAAGVLIARADKSFIASTAELTLGLYIDVARSISASTCDYRDNRIPPQRSGRQLRGQTAGIIGYGAIGSYLADLLIAVGQRVLVHDPFVESVPEQVESVDLRRLLTESDVVFPLAPGDPSTENLIGAEQLAVIRHGAILINVSRGELLDEDAVGAALDSGRLGGVGLDVGRAPDQRPSPALAARPGVVATPHLGGLTPQNADAQAASSVEQVAAILDGRIPPRAVNPDHARRLRDYWAR
jgi:D-3-phosphoglycerate dehydrogenase / 2-oxoglutarate reductase